MRDAHGQPMVRLTASTGSHPDPAHSKFAIADSNLAGCLPARAPGREANRPAGFLAYAALALVGYGLVS